MHISQPTRSHSHTGPHAQMGQPVGSTCALFHAFLSVLIFLLLLRLLLLPLPLPLFSISISISLILSPSMSHSFLICSPPFIQALLVLLETCHDEAHPSCRLLRVRAGDCTARHCTARHCTARHCTALHGTAHPDLHDGSRANSSSF